MPVYKDKNGTWYVMTRCDDWQGQRKQKCKRGFKTKREAQGWERRFLLQQGGDLDMLFGDFYKLYEQDMKARLKQNTWEHKACVIKSKIAPQGGVVLVAVLCCRKYYGVTSGALHPCNRCYAAFSLRPYLVSFRENLPVRAGDSLSASAVMKGVDAYDFQIGFRREKEVNPMNKKGEIMKQKRISFGQGKGSLTHNNREFMADNVDPIRTPQNITFVRQPIGEAYDQLFAESTERYNAKQKRNDRKVDRKSVV